MSTQNVSQTQKQPSPSQLWQNSYPTSKMLFQLSYMLFSLFLWILLINHSIQAKPNPFSVVIGFVLAQLVVDFISGLLHWGCDTWGTFYTPILGPTLIRSFRMHHVDPQDITKHGFVETNASSCYPMPFFIAAGLMIAPGNFFVDTYLWMVIFGVIAGIFTNEIHKWAHMVHSKPSIMVRFLQKSGLILSHEHHHKHHQKEFDDSYCIINGWMNPILEYIDFWRKMEILITKCTGAVPRADDAFWRDIKVKSQ